MDFSKDENTRKTIVEDMLSEISNFLKEHPYDYLNIVGLLNEILRESDKLTDNQFVEESLACSY